MPASPALPTSSSPAPQTASLSVMGSSGVSGAILIIAGQILWKEWQVEIPNETWMALMTIMVSVSHSLSRCRWCKKLMGEPLDSPVASVTAVATENGGTTLAVTPATISPATASQPAEVKS